MKTNTDRAIECFELLDRSSDPALCKQLFPDLVAQVEEYWALRQQLLPEAEAYRVDHVMTQRARFLSSIAQERSTKFSLRSVRLAVLGAFVGAMTIAAVGASAAAGGPGPAQGIDQMVAAIDALHGQSVKEAVQEAKENAAVSAAGGSASGLGKAVSLAACIAAHDRTSLPESAQLAPGQENRPEKDCEKTAKSAAESDKNKDDEAASGEEDDEAASGEEDDESASGDDAKKDPPGLSGQTPPGQLKKDAGGDSTDEAGKPDKCDVELDQIPLQAQTSPGQAKQEQKCEEATEPLDATEKPKGKPETVPPNKGVGSSDSIEGDSSEKPKGKPETVPPNKGGPPN